MSDFGQNVSSEMLYAADALGYAWYLKSFPNAELPSMRTPAVRNNLSHRPIVSCPNTPAFTLFTRVSSPVLIAAAPTVRTPGAGKLVPVAVTRIVLAKSPCTPADSSDEIRLVRAFLS